MVAYAKPLMPPIEVPDTPLIVMSYSFNARNAPT